MALKDCIDEAFAAAKGKITREEAADIVAKVQRAGKRARAEGDILRAEANAAGLIAEQAKRDKIKAALARKQAAINVIRRVERDADLATYKAAKLTPPQAFRAMMRGTVSRVQGARKSASSAVEGFASRYLGSILGPITAAKPHLERMLSPGYTPQQRREFDAFYDRVGTEMWERYEGGTKGVSGDEDARWMADTLGSSLEMARTDQNRLGANIGELEGYGYMPQWQDPDRLIRIDRENWIDKKLARIDVERSFPDVFPGEARQILSGSYDTIITGKANMPSAREKGQFTGPPNLARKMEEQRVLHFKSYADWRADQKEFGADNVLSAVLMRLKSSARNAGIMSVFGPNPGVMLKAMAESERARIKADATLKPETKKAWSDELAKIDKWVSFKVMMGEDHGIISPRIAKVAAGVRSVQQFGKLPAAVLSAVIMDPIILANNLRFHGMGMAQAFGRSIAGYFSGRGAGESRHIAALAGEGFDGLIDALAHPYAQHEGTPGLLSRIAMQTFRLTGMTWQFDAGRSVAARILQAELGSHAGKGFANLDIRFRNVLKLQGFTPEKWDALRKSAWKGENGSTYITPDKIADLADGDIDRLIRSDIADIRATAKTTEKADAAIARRRERARLDLELDLRRYIADEASFGIIRPDDATRAYTTGGEARGGWGEAIRMLMQFKAFPIAFTQRVLGRAFLSGPAYQTKAESILRNSLHIGELLGTLFVAGLATTWLKDVARGQSPKEVWNDDGANFKTIGAAMAQGGGLGIYGDFLFSKYNRFGGGALETLAGPAVGVAADTLDLGLSIRDAGVDPDAQYKNAQTLFRLAQGNLPFVNMWQVKAATDYLFMNSIREAVLPGYLRKQEREMRTRYGQERLLPATAF